MENESIDIKDINTTEKKAEEANSQTFTSSPTPTQVIKTEKTLTFFEALEEILDGKKVTKLEWADEGYYGLLENTRLRLHKPDGNIFDWILNDGDISGTDYTIVK